jgi:3-phosphoshikimate 1-carboxyvinyltransferase
LNFVIAPGGTLRGNLRVPGDKSISHRALMLGAIAEGTTDITGFSEGEDALRTLTVLRALGVAIDGPDSGHVVVHGRGCHGLSAPKRVLDVGNSGTSMRLLAGLLVGQPFASELTGDASLRRRPMRRITEPLTAMGAAVQTSAEGTPPLRIAGGRVLKGIDYAMPVASAQVKSCLLMAGLYAAGQTCVHEPAPTRDHTERMLMGMGYPLERGSDTVCLQGGGRLRGTTVEIPTDISSAAFFMVGASIAAGSDLVIEHVGVNPTRIGVITLLQMMGASIELSNVRTISGEPVANIRIRSQRLKGISIPASQVPLAIDELPAILVGAACAEGTTVLTGASELRVKESDRIVALVGGLQRLGIEARATEDGMIVHGGRLTSGHVSSHADHRIAMAFAIAGLRAAGPIVVKDCANVETSFPGFVPLARSIGLAIDVEA